MRQSLKHALLGARFQPSPWGILINPYYLVRRRLFLALRKASQQLSGSVLDFGAGMAPYRGLFAHAARYVTVDIAVSGHPDEEKRVDFHYDGKVLPFGDGEFDGVFSSEVFEHIFNLEDILAEINRVLKPGGQLLITMPFAWPEHEVPYDFGRYTSFGITNLLNRMGFEIVALTKTSNYIESTAQLFSAYFVQLKIVRGSAALTGIFTLLLAAPINLLGMLLGMLLPNPGTLYLNYVILAKKSPTESAS